MKRILQFILVFCLLLIGAYAKPVVSPQHSKQKITKNHKKEPSKNKQVAFKPSKVGALKAASFSKFINKSPESFTKQYGEPLEIQDNYLGSQWWVFGEDEHDYLQVEVKNNKICSIFVLGDKVDVIPLKIGMTLKDVAALTTIYSDFTSTYKGKSYAFELTEQDMNYRPLLAFDNDSFAMLHFSQDTGKLLGVRYLNSELLLRLMPYQLIEPENYPLSWPVQDEKKEISEAGNRQLEMMIRIMRKRDKLPAYSFSPTKRLEAERLIVAFEKEPQNYFESMESFNEWQSLTPQDNKMSYRTLYKLNTKSYQQLVKEPEENNHGFLLKPSQDIPYILMSIYGNSSGQKHFLRKEDNEIGLATTKNHILILLTNKKNQEDSLSSESTEVITSEVDK
ncbi:CAP-associated domain-containing protein [Vagococcus sp. PNs007]|uniref:CAP-associated domain-containing protein n=1 Tax=Vagococcus proximus TaxID=2991417 RepID=A0ABT5WY54_9ENTE|nr:CAP-associated domain-containing protein [Vagococcus proximus]MDF0478667.1 CAP-associated domain-containing protein [Vagococcus proximus]